MKIENFDLIVIGAGPGGIEAALLASKKNLSVALISATKIGGRATWGSLVPSKVWLASAEKARSFSTAGTFGFKTDDQSIQLDLDLLRKKVGQQSNSTSERYQQKLNKAGVNIFFGKANVKAAQSVNIELNDGTNKELKAQNIIVATGSGPRFTPEIKPNKDQIIAPKIAPGVVKIPDNMVMAGGGVTGTEYAYAFAALGTKVTIIQNGQHLLPRLDTEVSHMFEEHITTNFPIEIVTGTKVLTMEQDGQTVKTVTSDGQKFESEYGFIAIGRKPDLSFLGNLTDQLELNQDQSVKVDEFGQTNISGLYAIGDVTGTPMTANRATMQARVAVEHMINGTETTLYPANFIEAIYTSPAVAQIGNPEETDQSILAIKKEYSDLLKANIRHKTAGFLKISIDKNSGLILGASGFGDHMPDLMALIQVAMNNNITYKDLNKTPLAYPSVSELITNLD